MLMSAMITTLREKLFDPAPGAGWADAEFIDYANRTQQRIAFVKPEAYPVQTTMGLNPGDTQVLPPDGVALLNIIKNIHTGRVVEQVSLDLLKASDWYWPNEASTGDIECYASDPRDPRRFYVSPPAQSGSAVELIYGAVPPTLALTTDATVLPESYDATIIDGVLALAFAKASRRQDKDRSDYHQELFNSALGLKTKAQFAIAPKVSGTPDR